MILLLFDPNSGFTQNIATVHANLRIMPAQNGRYTLILQFITLERTALLICSVLGRHTSKFTQGKHCNAFEIKHYVMSNFGNITPRLWINSVFYLLLPHLTWVNSFMHIGLEYIRSLRKTIGTLYSM